VVVVVVFVVVVVGVVVHVVVLVFTGLAATVRGVHMLQQEFGIDGHKQQAATSPAAINEHHSKSLKEPHAPLGRANP
jgi:hypothetical protein